LAEEFIIQHIQTLDGLQHRTQKAVAIGGELQLVAQEANAWAKQNFANREVFTILGL